MIHSSRALILLSLISFTILSSCRKDTKAVEEDFNWELVQYATEEAYTAYDENATEGIAIPNIDFIGPNTVFMGGGDGGYGPTGFAYRSTNSGQNWNLEMLASDGSFMDKFCFVDENLGFMAYLSFGTTYFKKTTDGGDYWFDISGYPWGPTIEFINDTLGYTGGTRTTDGGLTWDDMGLGGLFGRTYFFLDDLNGFSSTGGDLYETNDAGFNWTAIYSGSDNITEVEFLNASVGFMTTESALMKSVDGGSSWEYLGPLNSAFYFVDENVGFAAKDYSIYKTTDGGSSWTLNFKSSGLKIMDMDGQGDIVIATGQEIVTGEPTPVHVAVTTTLGD